VAAVQGFGFLKTDSGEEFFCHISNVKLRDSETLQEGDLMQFSTKTEYDGRLQVRTTGPGFESQRTRVAQGPLHAGP